MLTAIEFWAVEDTRVIEFKLPAHPASEPKPQSSLVFRHPASESQQSSSISNLHLAYRPLM